MIASSSLWSPRQIAEAVNGSLSGSMDVEIRGVGTDTRDELNDHLFVALKGERFDAHDFLEKAIERGASALLTESTRLSDEERELFGQTTAIIEVEDTTFALGELAAAQRQRIGVPVIALTGSNGKTTTKEMIASILKCDHSVLKTQGNFNNLIGLPMTLLGLREEHEIAVIEMGMNARGEIERLTEITQPNIGLITNVGPAHIGMLGSMDEIIAAKGELFAGLKEGTKAIHFADDPRFRALIPENMQSLSFGFTSDADIRVESATPSSQGQHLKLKIPGGRIEVELPYPGKHNANNAAAAVATVLAMFPETKLDSFIVGLSTVSNAARRLDVKQVGPYLVVDDCYNANGDSMVAAIQTVANVAKTQGRRWVAVLGEMRELGEWSESEHARVGSALVENRVAFAAAFGGDALGMVSDKLGADFERHHSVDDFEGLCSWVNERLSSGDVILVKGSRGTRMERFIERLEGEVN